MYVLSYMRTEWTIGQVQTVQSQKSTKVAINNSNRRVNSGWKGIGSVPICATEPKPMKVEFNFSCLDRSWHF